MRDPKDAAAVRIFPPAIPVGVIVAGLILNRMLPISGGGALSETARHWLGGGLVVGAILALGVWPIALFRRSGQSENPWTPTTRILDDGPYKRTRNPLYLGMLLICVGFALILSNWWILALTPVGGWLLRRLVILPEEAYLERTFGATYLAYKRRVRRWL
jgi:protein-S-isoprenylcysteine O-methyltransferase Ste14